jgi:hypothetical protein
MRSSLKFTAIVAFLMPSEISENDHASKWLSLKLRQNQNK